MILEVSWDGLWTLSFWLAQFHGHGSWLVCEVALRVIADLQVEDIITNGKCHMLHFSMQEEDILDQNKMSSVI